VGAATTGAGAARRRGEHTRERLLEAGTTVFATRGVHAARVDDIVKGAKTSHGTFYLYFQNKEELFRALAERAAGDLEALAARLPALTPDAAGREALTAWMRDFGTLYAGTGAVIRVWTETEMVANDAGRLGTTVWGAFTAALADRIRATRTAGVDPAVAALVIVAMIERANYYLLRGQLAEADGEDLASTLAGVTQAALFGGGRADRA
jgi:AcrR family transcriptional regulator